MRFPFFQRKGKREFEQNMTDELRFHVEQQTAANISAGMKPEEARRQARLQLGAVFCRLTTCSASRKASARSSC